MTPKKQNFKVTPLFDAEYPTNGTVEYCQGLTHAILKGVISNDLE